MEHKVPILAQAAVAILLTVAPLALAQDASSMPQCDPTFVYYPKNIQFLGPAQSVQVGTVNFSYHDFGPLLIFDNGVQPSPPLPAPTDAAAPAEAPTPSASPQPAVIFIHGFGSTQYDWPLDLLESVSNERRVIIFDNPGIGMSNDTTTEPLTIDYMASATAGLIDALGLDRPDVVGYSMGGDIALTLATNYSDKVGGVVAVAGSFGGPAAPQPPAGLANVLYELEQVFLSKSQAYSAGAANITSSSAQNATADPMVLFFPLGSLDPAYCNMMRDFVSLLYATGMFPIDASAGYALPGGVYTSGIIPSRTALVPTQVAMDNQTAALMLYHTAESSVAEALPNATNQILYIAGVQDNVIPITTQVAAAELTPGSWLIQVPNGGHGLPFLDPTDFATTVTSFLDGAQDIGPVPRSYYATPAASGAGAVKAAWAMLMLLCSAAVAAVV